MANRHAIAHEFILHEAIVRLVAVLSQLCSGLQSLNFLDVVRRIPETFRPLFVYDEAPDISGIIISCLSFPSNMSTSEEAVGSLLKSYLRGRSQAGELNGTNIYMWGGVSPLLFRIFAAMI